MRLLLPKLWLCSLCVTLFASVQDFQPSVFHPVPQRSIRSARLLQLCCTTTGPSMASSQERSFDEYTAKCFETKEYRGIDLPYLKNATMNRGYRVSDKAGRGWYIHILEENDRQAPARQVFPFFRYPLALQFTLLTFLRHKRRRVTDPPTL